MSAIKDTATLNYITGSGSTLKASNISRRACRTAGFRKIGVYHPGELYNPQKADKTDPYSKANPFSGTRYHNMLSALKLTGNCTLGDVLKNSDETVKKLRETLKQQKDRTHLRNYSLPPVPQKRAELVVASVEVDKNVAKRATNVAHSKLTNGGFTRTTYGGFYMH